MEFLFGMMVGAGIIVAIAVILAILVSIKPKLKQLDHTVVLHFSSVHPFLQLSIYICIPFFSDYNSFFMNRPFNFIIVYLLTRSGGGGF